MRASDFLNLKTPLPAGWRRERRFNRLDTDVDRVYFSEYGINGIGPKSWKGWAKVRLLHGRGNSLVVVDQLYLGDSTLRWIQPLSFVASMIAKFKDDDIRCTLHVDVSYGHTLRIQFTNQDQICNFGDGSQLYECEITGPVDLPNYATGEAEFASDKTPYLRLYHHTTADSRDKILASSHFRTGAYNIQGSSKKLTNVAYAYLTPIDSIVVDNDLRKIAMAKDGKIVLATDGFEAPRPLPPDYLDVFKDDILSLPVYSCDPAKREACVDVWVDATALAPQHISRHAGLPVYYEYPHHFIHRIGMEPGHHVEFDANRRIHRQPYCKGFEYVVVGDCRTVQGLAAPYDEEDTTHIMKIERPPSGASILEFWCSLPNADHFTGKLVQLQQFDPPARP